MELRDNIQKKEYFKSIGIKCGLIYKLESPSGNIYIGQTIKPIQDRFRAYKKLYKSTEGQSKLYNAIQKHGWSSFKKEIIGYYPQELLNEAEIFWIEYYNSFSRDNRNGLNLTNGGDSPTRCVPSPLKGKPNLRHQETSIPLDIYNENKEFVISLKSMLDAEKYTGFSRLCIRRYLKEKTISHDYKYYIVSKGGSVESYTDRNRNKRKVYMYDINGNFIKEFESVRLCSREIKSHTVTIVDCMNDKKSHIGDFIFRSYKSDRINVNDKLNMLGIHHYSKDGVLLNIFKTKQQAMDALNISFYKISRYLNGANIPNDYILKQLA